MVGAMLLGFAAGIGIWRHDNVLLWRLGWAGDEGRH